MDVHELWEEVKNKIKKEINLASYETWIKDTTAHEIVGEHFVVIADNVFMRDWLNHRYKDQLEKLLHEVLGEKKEICFIVDKSSELPLPNITKEQRQLQVKYLIDQYKKDKERVKQLIDLGKTLEEICVEMDVHSREDLVYTLSLIKEEKTSS